MPVGFDHEKFFERRFSSVSQYFHSNKAYQVKQDKHFLEKFVPFFMVDKLLSSSVSFTIMKKIMIIILNCKGRVF